MPRDFPNIREWHANLSDFGSVSNGQIIDVPDALGGAAGGGIAKPVALGTTASETLQTLPAVDIWPGSNRYHPEGFGQAGGANEAVALQQQAQW